ncbi:MAG TPA: serine/threonine protein phosphatase [Treponema sp.]|nr:serine/threonine protein phosphatase [Treponema sp.]
MTDNSFFEGMTSPHFNPEAVLDLSGGGKALILSDLHMGTGRRDDFAANGELVISMLEEYYFKGGWYLILNGDIEELQGYSYDNIRERWFRLFRVFDLFAGDNRLYKIVGNHDEALLLRKSYPYALHTVVRVNTGVVPAFVYHGHQGSRVFLKYNKLLGVGVRFFLKPFGIKNISSARSPNRRFHVEKMAYQFSLENHCLSIIGHTHRPLFASLGRFDFIKFEIERLCREYPEAPQAKREKIGVEVSALRRELGKLKRKERRDVLRQSLYGDELPVPCLFNSGCAIGNKGLNAIELSGEDIALVYWYTEGDGKPFVSRGAYHIDKLGPHRRAILNKDRLDYIWARVRLLGD